MLRIITAATALAVLVACDSEGIDRVTTGDQTPVTVPQDDQVGTDTDTETAGNTTEEGDNTGTDADGGDDTTTGSDGTDDDIDTSEDSTGGCASGVVQSIEDGGSSTSDCGITQEDDPTEETAETTPAEPEADAGSFATDTGDGNTIRTSSLSSATSEQACTTLADPDDYSNIYIGDFILHNNAWRTFRAPEGYAWEQCIYTNTNGALVGWNYDWGPGRTGVNGNPNPSGDFYVRSYPELIYGVKDEFRVSAPQSETGLPVMISEMPTFQIDYAYDGPQSGEPRVVDASNNSRFPNGSTISGERNVAVESFFYETDAAGNCTTDIVTRNGGSNHTYEVMVWLDAGAERLPAGPNDFVADLTVRGADYKVYTKDSDDRYIAFVAQNPQTTGTIYMNDFIDWARENAHVVSTRFGANSDSVEIQDDWCMANILVGTEIFWGAGSMNITDWTITQTQ